MDHPAVKSRFVRPNPRPIEPSSPVDPVRWVHAPRAWRAASWLTPRHVDLYLRVRSGRGLPRSFWGRFAAMGLPQATIERALGEIKGLGDWTAAWNREAQRHLGEARRADGAGGWREAAVARRHAAMCYHAAHLVTDTDARTVRALRGSAVTLFSQAVPLLMAETRKVEVAWRTAKLPAYLRKPREIPPPWPLAVLLNGATTIKEELLLWSDPFIDQGIAVLTLDWPGTGEAYDVGSISGHCDDVTDGILGFVDFEPGLDPSRVALVGFSLGGAVAVRAAALDRRIAACVSVTGPYDASRWIGGGNPIVRQQLQGLVGERTSLDRLVAEFSLTDVLGRLRSPLLALGAGRDLVVPPEEAIALSAAAGEFGTLVWYAEGSHGLYEHVADWTETVARWIGSVLGEVDAQASTRVERDDGSPPPVKADAALSFSVPPSNE